VGYINRDLLAKQMPPPASDSLILVCGPPGMMKSISGDKLPDKSQGPLSGLLKDMGYTEQQVG
jgi:cytochrome-b5 reductase